jgi:TonB family protein
MAQTQAVAMVENWQQWDGRIVNGKFPLRYLGCSEQSAVYLTELEGAPVAIKLIPADSPQASMRIARWKLAGRLSHPNLVRLFETGLWHADNEQDMLFAVMEYCEESLAGVLRQRPLTSAETREMLVPALDALNYLHSQDILHGQVKPPNIMAMADQLKLSSDGVHRTNEADHSGVPGPYDPPEKSTGTVSLSGDIWSLGVTLVEALTNRLPARDKNRELELMELAPPFDAIAKGCLNPDPEGRLSITAIRNLLAGASAEAKPETKPVAMPEAKAIAVFEVPSSPERPTAPSGSAPATLPSPDKSAVGTAFAGKRGLVLISAVVLLILAIVVGMHLTRKSSETPQPATATVAQQDKASGATATKKANASAAKPAAPAAGSGAVLHEVMPEVSGQARNTINGTVKVSVRVTVDTRGEVSRATLVAQGPSKYFSGQALQAARRWTFVAPIRNGKQEASAWTLSFEFRKAGTKATARRMPLA